MGLTVWSCASTVYNRLHLCAAIPDQHSDQSCHEAGDKCKLFFNLCWAHRGYCARLHWHCCELKFFRCDSNDLAYHGQVSTAFYTHKTYQVVTMLRGALIPLIFEKTLTIPATSDAAGVTLVRRPDITRSHILIDFHRRCPPTLTASLQAYPRYTISGPVQLSWQLAYICWNVRLGKLAYSLLSRL